MKDLINGASAFIFDLEGVVLDTETIWDEAQRILLSRRGHDYNRAALKHQLTGLGAQQAIAALVAHYRLPDDPSSLLLERWEIMAELLSQGVNYIPGALDFVRHAAVVVDICAATSMDPSLLDIALSATDLRAGFPGPIFTSADVNGVAKPAPDIFLYAASKLGFESADCLVIEDAPHGIAAARAAGIPCIALCTTHKRYRLSGADMIFSDWSEVPRPSGLGRDQGCVENA
ncbi:HAD family hydrolase [Nonomuraea sp. H19]|uniref:HAD family hydrolase n=1 Tax=Nonomuraea sp. H19 TaxID=3452206 RepID=UPI003F8B838D